MHPRLQTAFDVMLLKATPFIPEEVAKDAPEAIANGDYAHVATSACRWLLVHRETPSNAQAHRSAVAAFGEFWRVLTELSYGLVEPRMSGAEKAAILANRLAFIIQGLRTGSIRSKGVLETSESAEEFRTLTLEQVIVEDLGKAGFKLEAAEEGN
jgi:hypothetical protein